MSTILKALKKIEGRKVETTLPTWPYGQGGRESMDSQIHRSRNRQKILGILLFLSVIALAGKFYFVQRPASQSPAPEKASIPSTAIVSDKSVTNEKTVKVQSQNTIPEAPPNQETVPEAPPSSVAAPAPAKSSETTETAEPSTAAAAVQSPEAAESEISPPADTAASAPEKPAPETFDAAPLDDAGLSLQALVWSEQPEARFAVINGDIVREGDVIDESRVVRIESEFVVLRTDGATWRLE